MGPMAIGGGGIVGDLKTHHRWGLVEGTGVRAFVAPDDPRHPANGPPDTG
jgi:hypothetical protein